MLPPYWKARRPWERGCETVSCSLLLRMATMDMAKFQIERGWVRADYYLINNTRPI